MSTATAPPTSLSLRPDVVATVLEDGAVLLDLDSKYFYSLNSTAWSIVQLFEQGTSIPEVESRCEEWGVPAAERNTVAQFIDTLLTERLVVGGSAGAPGISSPSAPAEWVAPRLEKHREPLQRVMVSAFDPSIPLAE